MGRESNLIFGHKRVWVLLVIAGEALQRDQVIARRKLQTRPFIGGLLAANRQAVQALYAERAAPRISLKPKSPKN